MRNLFARLLLNTVALWFLTLLYPGVYFRAGAGLLDYLVAGAVWGLFTLVVNGLVLFLVAAVTPLEVAGFGAALVGALVLSLVSLVLSWALKD